ncbi:MAG: DMT family transporter [Rhizobiaceae bacterium]
MAGTTRTATAYALLAAAPVFFSTNVVLGKAALEIEPFTLAALRWSITAAILWLFSRRHWPAMIAVMRQSWKLLAVCGFLGMWICGALVYLALKYTSATNGTLIYTLPPVIIVLVERVWRGRALKARELSGILLAFLGVVAIVLRGDISALANLRFNPGDLIFLLAAFAWAIYTVLLKSKAFAGLQTIPLLAVVAAMGAAQLVPFAIAEVVITGNFPDTSYQWALVSGIVLFASIISFSAFQYGISVLGASIAGIFLYLLPPCGIALAWLFLGERLAPYHLAGMALVLGGVILATFPAMARRA